MTYVAKKIGDGGVGRYAGDYRGDEDEWDCRLLVAGSIIFPAEQSASRMLQRLGQDLPWSISQPRNQDRYAGRHRVPARHLLPTLRYIRQESQRW